MNSMRSPYTKLHASGFTLIEVVLALGVFLVSVLALVGLLGPMIQSVDNIEKMDEITSVVHTVDAFLQSSPDIGDLNANPPITKFNAIYEAVANDGFATLFVFRQYVSDDDIILKIGFLGETEAMIDNDDVTDGTQVKAAGPIYRIVLTPASVMPITYYANTIQNSNGVTVPARNDDGVYELAGAYTLANAYLEGYFAMEARIFVEDPSLVYDVGTLPNGEVATVVESFKDIEPDFTFPTAIVR
jgi:type II secretory pathway pseudopilin PulG